MPKLIEIIEFLDNSGNTMVKRIPEEGSGEFKFGAQLILRESQKAVFFRDGKSLDVFSAGRHVLKTQNIPIITKLITGLTYGNESPFKSEVYFLNMKLFSNLGWGTREPIIFRDTELKMIRLRGNGTFSIQIKEPTLFLNKIAGTQGLFTDKDITDYLRSIIVHKLHVSLGTIFKTVFDLPQNFDNLSILVKKNIFLDFEGLGLELHDFSINSISVPPEVQQMIDKRTGMSAIENLDDFMKLQIGQSIEKAAGNTSSNAGEGLGLGAGIGLGFMMPQIINQTMQKNENESTIKEDSFEKLKKLKGLIDIGVITIEEFNETKKRILNNL